MTTAASCCLPKRRLPRPLPSSRRHLLRLRLLRLPRLPKLLQPLKQVSLRTRVVQARNLAGGLSGNAGNKGREAGVSLIMSASSRITGSSGLWPLAFRLYPQTGQQDKDKFSFMLHNRTNDYSVRETRRPPR